MTSTAAAGGALTPLGPELPSEQDRPAEGGASARRAVRRWATRLFLREWRQQLLVLALLTLAVAAAVVGSTVTADTAAPADIGFGTAEYAASLAGSPAAVNAQLAALRHRVGRVEVIENQAIAVPGTVATIDLRSQDPRGPYGGPMLTLLSGHYPTRPDQVAVTPGVASDFHLSLGSTWRAAGRTWHVVGMVEDPESLLDEFALVEQGQVPAPTQVTALFDTTPAIARLLGPGVTHRSSPPPGTFSSSTLVMLMEVVGMLLVALVAVGGFTVVAQRRLRSIGMLAAIGASDRNLRRVVRANGAVVGIAATVAGLVLGFLAWILYRPSLESSAHHVIGLFQLPWPAIIIAAVLAPVAATFAASRPARRMARVPVLTALSGRPITPPPPQRHAIPGVICLAVGAILMTYAGTSRQNGQVEVILGFVALIAAIVLLSPFALRGLGYLARHLPVPGRLALRDLARYCERGGSALAAMSLASLIAAAICVVAFARYSNPLDYVGPNLASNQLIVYLNYQGPNPTPASSVPSAARSAVERMAAGLGATTVVELESTSANLSHAAPGRNYTGPLYVATPQLLRAFGIRQSEVSPTADILTMRPGLAGMSGMQLTWQSEPGQGGAVEVTPGKGTAPPGPRSHASYPCPRSTCLANPKIEQVSALPSGTSAPNTVITEHAVRALHLASSLSTSGWLLQAPQPFTTAQVAQAAQLAAAAHLSIESKGGDPTSSEILGWATAVGIGLALAILAMTIGLIRSETASTLRTLTATGAAGRTRRAVTAVTGGTLALLSALIGTAVAYIAALSFFSSNVNGDSISELASVPWTNLSILVVGFPLLAAVGGFLLAGREPPAIAHQPLE
ncbi:MAG TPA: FtsX-like permease family protein [Acidimicrobiales bacterium]|nr:FtsX-like permease family protein [Acidimicrobiales bacterium]